MIWLVFIWKHFWVDQQKNRFSSAKLADDDDDDYDDDNVPVMIGRVHRRVQYFGGNRLEAVPASDFGSENDQDEDNQDE